jgi:polyhydroxybutyrate depolymerase
MISKRAKSFVVFMIAIALSLSNTLAQDAPDNSESQNRRATQGTNRPQRQGGEPRKQINPRQREAVRKLRERTENGSVPTGLERRKIQVGKTEREYFINIPQSCQDKPSPVVFVLHGGATSSGIAMHLKTDFTKLGASAGYVTVYPSGINGWNIGSHDMYSVQRRTSNADDVGFFRTMFDELIEKKIADPARIYLVGGSNGGVMTQYLVCNLADRIAAAGVIVATLPRAAETKWPKPTKPVPMIVLLGTEDPMKPWDGNRDQMSAEETIAYWRKQNKCDSEGKKWELPDKDPRDGCRIHAQRWGGTAPVVFYTMQGHGHGWPMQRRRANEDLGKGTNDISAPEEFWGFFEKLRSSKSDP